MDEHEPASLSADERDERLGSGGIGVLAFADGEGASPHTVPVSYGYDATEETFYFRLAVGADSEKGRKRDVADRAVTFVTYGDDDGWWSVVARGRLEPIEREDVATDSLAGLDRVEIPLVDVFGDPPGSVTFAFVRLEPDALTTRREAPTGI